MATRNVNAGVAGATAGIAARPIGGFYGGQPKAATPKYGDVNGKNVWDGKQWSHALWQQLYGGGGAAGAPKPAQTPMPAPAPGPTTQVPVPKVEEPPKASLAGIQGAADSGGYGIGEGQGVFTKGALGNRNPPSLQALLQGLRY